MGLVDETKQKNFGILMKLMKKGYGNVNAIKQYGLEVLNKSLAEKQLTVGELAKACYLSGFSNKPVQYLERVLEGTEPMTGRVLDRLSCILNLRMNAVFPFKRIGKEEAYDAEKEINGRDIREDSVRKDYRWQCLGAHRCMDLREFLFFAA